MDTLCEPSNPNHVHLQRGAYQTKALDGSFKNHIHTSSKTHHLSEETGLEGENLVSKCREKHTFEIHVLREIIELSKSAESRGRMQHVLQARYMHI
jgi:hypothetical protein